MYDSIHTIFANIVLTGPFSHAAIDEYCKIVLWWKGWQAISKHPSAERSENTRLRAKHLLFKVGETTKPPLRASLSPALYLKLTLPDGGKVGTRLSGLN